MTMADEKDGLQGTMAAALPNKLVEQLIRTPGRIPSPQPSHYSVGHGNGNGNGHKVLRSATVGYIAPPFEGKNKQMEEGKL